MPRSLMGFDTALTGLGLLLSVWAPALGTAWAAPAPDVLPQTQPLTNRGDRSRQVITGLDKFLTRALEQAPAGRQRFWQRDFSSRAAYENSVAPNRERLRKLLGVVDPRVPGPVSDGPGNESAKVAETDVFTAWAVRWPVVEGITGEGLWLRPKQAPVARVVALPDAGQTPEAIAGLAPGLAPERQFARRLAENGCEVVVVPLLLDRRDAEAGSRQPVDAAAPSDRERIYRQAFALGRHPLGYEVQKVLAAVDCFAGQSSASNTPNLKIGVAGYAEGGLLAFYCAALEPRVEAALVSGYFDSRQRLWQEPVWRNVFGLLREFGDAEIATLIAPRRLVVEHSPAPHPVSGRAAPGQPASQDYASVETEFERARSLLRASTHGEFDSLELISGTEGLATGPGSERALTALLNALGVKVAKVGPPGAAPADLRSGFTPAERQQRQVKELEEALRQPSRGSESARAEFFLDKLKAATPAEWEAARLNYRNLLQDEVLGCLPALASPANPRSRRVPMGSVPHNHIITPESASARVPPPESAWTSYELLLDVFPDVFAWGWLLVPADLKPGEQRPAMVCSHGLKVMSEPSSGPGSPGAPALRLTEHAIRLADEGFVVFASYDLDGAGEEARLLERKASPLKLSLDAVCVARYGRLLDWLGQFPAVDARRIGYYGLSSAGPAALYAPVALEGFAVSICPGDFNNWEAGGAIEFLHQQFHWRKP